MNDDIANNLASVLSQAALIEFSKGFSGDVFEHDPGKESGPITVAAGPVISLMFEPIEGVVANIANITFTIYFVGCTYCQKAKEYLWDGKEYALETGDYNPNILLAEHEQGEGEPDWGNCDSEDAISDKQDREISETVVQYAFKNMSDERKVIFLQDVLRQTNKALRGTEENCEDF